MESNLSQQVYTSEMRFTIDGRPFLNDIHDLFAALIVQTPLDTNRYLFRNYYSTFTSEDAIQALGNLQFSHTISTPDPNDSGRVKKITTTTTFKMAREMAKTLCQRFQNCRLMENAVDPHNRTFRDKGIWHLTPKGLCVLQDFCLRTEVEVTGFRKHFGRMEAIQLARLERSSDDDQLVLSRSRVSAIFRVMMTSLPLDGELASTGDVYSASVTRIQTTDSPSSSIISDSSANSLHSLSAPFTMSSSVSGSETHIGLLGNYLLTLSNHKSQPKTLTTMRTVFSSQMCCDWLLDYCMTSCREETEMIVNEFLRYDWIEYQDPKHKDMILKVSKTNIFVVTEKGKQTVSEKNPVPGLGTVVTFEKQEQESRKPESLTSLTTCKQDDIADNDCKEGSSAKLQIILQSPRLRSSFKEFLRANFCEENLDFWIEYNTLKRRCRNQSPAMTSHSQKDLVQDAYDIWSTYLAPEAPCELNVEHSLCQEMSRIVHSVVTIIPSYPGTSKTTILITTSSASQSLRMLLKLLDKINDHICKLMASDSVPRFIKTEKYRKIAENIENVKHNEMKRINLNK